MGAALDFSISERVGCGLGCAPTETECNMSSRLIACLVSVAGWWMDRNISVSGLMLGPQEQRTSSTTKTENTNNITKCRPHLVRTRTIYTNKNNRKYKPTRTTTKNLVVLIVIVLHFLLLKLFFAFELLCVLYSCPCFCFFVLFIVIDLVLCCCCCCCACSLCL